MVGCSHKVNDEKLITKGDYNKIGENIANVKGKATKICVIDWIIQHLF